jgi:ribonucleoside-triphosphate reductase
LNGEVSAEALPEPNWGPIGKAVYERTYRRGDEVWADTVKRVVLGNLSYAPEATLEGEAEKLFDLIYHFKAIPAGRHLWTTGTKASHFNRNCWVSGWSSATEKHFQFAAARLFEGGGVGSNYSADLLAVTDPLISPVDVMITCRPDHSDFSAVKSAAGDLFVDASGSWPVYVVEDTREGWIELWTKLIADASELDSQRYVIDLSELRQYGAELKTFGGRASGPAPLADSTRKILSVINSVASDRRRLTGLEAMTVDHYMAASIVAGGARRSARMSLMRWDDPDILNFIKCKNDHLEHWSTNISIEINDEYLDRLDADDPLALLILDEIVKGMIENGEPGVVNTSLHSTGEPTPIRMVNPCGEASLSASIDADGSANGESCNLGSVNLEAFGLDWREAEEAFRLMARFLLRSTQNPHSDESASIIERQNRRIGVGILGLQGWAAAHEVPLSQLPASELLARRLSMFRVACRDAANELADELGIPHPVKVTAVAPTGTIAQMGGTTPGVSAAFAKYFVRRVRYANSDPQLAIVKAQGHNCVPDIYADDTTVVEYVVRDAILDRYRHELIEDVSELSIEDYFGIVATVQQSFCSGEDGQAVSSTATIPKDIDPKQLRRAVSYAMHRLKGVTVFPEESRPLSPYERLSEDEYLRLASQVNVEADAGDSNDGACVGGACPVR